MINLLITYSFVHNGMSSVMLFGSIFKMWSFHSWVAEDKTCEMLTLCPWGNSSLPLRIMEVFTFSVKQLNFCFIIAM